MEYDYGVIKANRIMGKKLIASIGRTVGLIVLFLVGCYIGIFAMIYFMFHISNPRHLILVFMVALVSAGLVVIFKDSKANKHREEQEGKHLAQVAGAVMNYKQIVCLWLGIAVIVLMGLYPAKENLSILSTKPYFQIKPDLLIKWAIVAVVTASLALAFRDKKDRQNGKLMSQINGPIMNWKQKVFVWIGIAVIVLMGLFPPHGPWSNISRRANLGFFPLFKVASHAIKLSRLYLQWAIVGVITVGLILSFKGRERKKYNGQQK